jgi:HAD superfamily hydrolase (TIGR01450 family)
VADTLAERDAGVVCDLDGVVRRGTHAVPYAVERLLAVQVPIVYATNNASLTPQDVADQLLGLGLAVGPANVVTSSQAGAAYVATLFPPDSLVLAVGGPGVAAALAEAGLRPVDQADPGVVAVLQGYGANVTAALLAEASYAIEDGATWVATNRDATLPTQRGIAPGNGALIGAVAVATGVQPSAATGKPEPPLYELSVSRLGVPKAGVLAIGDRLDTDILGAMNAGLDSLWVLTGVDDLVSFARSPGRPAPTYAARDLRVLDRPPVVPTVDGETVQCGSVSLSVDWRGGGLRVTSGDDPDALIAATTAALVHGRDAEGTSVDGLVRMAETAAARLG